MKGNDTELIITICGLCRSSMGVEIIRRHGKVSSAICPGCGTEHYFEFNTWLYFIGRIRKIFRIVFGMKEANNDSKR